MSERIDAPSTAAIARAADRLRAGMLVAFPTETVYGLGADAGNPEAVRRIFAAKGRPADHPVIVHSNDAAQMADWARSRPGWGEKAGGRVLAGSADADRSARPRTSTTSSPEARTASACACLRTPSPASSWPRSAAASPRPRRTASAASRRRPRSMSPTIWAMPWTTILDGGACAIGIESTIVAFTDDYPVLLRPGRHRRFRAVAGARPAARRRRCERASRVRDASFALRAEDAGPRRRRRFHASRRSRSSTTGTKSSRCSPAPSRALPTSPGSGSPHPPTPRNTRTISIRTCARSMPPTPTSS